MSLTLSAQPPKRFYTHFGGYGHEVGYSVIQTLNGNYAVTGSTSSFGSGNTDVYLAIIDSMGMLQSEKSYGGFNNDIGRSIIQLADSGFVIAGYTNSFGSGGYDMYVVRTDKTGSMVWQKTYGGLDWDFAYCVRSTTAGDSLIICGNTYSYGYGKSDAFIVKADMNGIMKWQRTYGGIEDDDLKSFIITYDNKLAFAGSSKSFSDPKGDGWILKTGISGDSIFSLPFGNNNTNFLNDIKEHPASKCFFACGAYDQSGKDTLSAWFMAASETGAFIYQDAFTYKVIKDEQYYALAFQKDTQFVYVRKNFKSSSNSTFAPMISVFSNITYKTGTKYGSSNDPDELFSIANTRDKGFICVGYTKGFNSNLSDIFLVKLDSTTLNSASIVGINQASVQNESFSVYPTLTSGPVYVSSAEPNRKIEIRIIDCFGKLLLTKESKEVENELDLNNFKEGVYFITVSSEGRNKTFKIIKSN
jgi:hypothetical protein